jgi:hypothetical protein
MGAASMIIISRLMGAASMIGACCGRRRPARERWGKFSRLTGAASMNHD